MAAEQTRSVLSLPGSRVLLCGSGIHIEGSRLPDIASVADSVSDLARALTGACGLDTGHIRALVDPDGPRELGGALVEAAEQATDVLMVYYVGHGLVGRDRQLYLATRQTADLARGIPDEQALRYSNILGVIEQSPARMVIIVLDCCFAGLARGARSEGADGAFASTRRRGTYLLAATGPDENAWAPPGERHTAFTGELIRLLEEGNPAGPPWLTIDDLYSGLDQALAARGLPRPRRQVADSGDQGILAVNRAYREPQVSGLPGVATAGGESPYRGLAPYAPENARFFFGRDAMITALVSRVAEWAGELIIVTGASGSGKSSLLHAGLIAAADDGRIGGASITCQVVTPESNPLRRLRAGLASAERAGSGGCILIVDQLEELFAPDISEPERLAFVELLSASARVRPVVLGVRADFYGQCTLYPELLTALENPFVVGPMSAEELRAAIEGPAGAAGLVVQDKLTDLVLRDLRAAAVSGGSGAVGVLPFLSYAMLATWQHREGSTLSLDAYHATGGIDGAVAQAADRIIRNLAAGDKQIVRRLLIRLVRIGDGTDDTRRTLPFDELMPLPGDAGYATASTVLGQFIAARLLTVENNTITISHEALIRAWPQLGAWINEDRAGLLQWQRLTDAAVSWHEAGREQAEVYRGQRLAAAREWADDPAHHGDIGTLAREFLDASNASELSALHAERRRARALKAFIAVVLVFAAVSASAAIVASRAQRTADSERDTAVAGQLIVQSQSIGNTDPALSRLESVAAWRIDPSPAASYGMLQAAALPGVATLNVSTQSITGVEFGRGSTLVTVSRIGGLRIWDSATGRQGDPLDLARSNADTATAAAFSSDGSILAVATASGLVQLWDMTGRRPAVMKPISAGKPSPSASALSAIAISPDAKIVATAGGDGTVRLWSVTSRRQTIARIRTGTQPVAAVAFSPDGATLATAAANGAVRLWDTATGAPAATLLAGQAGNPSGEIAFVAFSPDGRFLASVTGTGMIRLWNASTLQEVGSPLSGDGGPVSSVAFSPDGTILASAGNDGSVRMWDVATQQQIANPLDAHAGPVDSIGFSEDGALLASGNYDGTVRLWDMRRLFQAATLTGGIGGIGGIGGVSGISVAFSADGKILAAASLYRAVLWDAATRREEGSLMTSRTTAVSGLAYPAGAPDAIAFSPKKNILATVTDRGVTLWDASTRRRIANIKLSFATPVWGVAFSPDGNTLATAFGISGPRSTVVQLWNVNTHAEIAPLFSPSLASTDVNVQSLAFSPDGKTIAAATIAGTVLWNVASGKQIHGLLPSLQFSDALATAFSRDGSMLAVSEGNTVTVWNTSGWEQVGKPFTSNNDPEDLVQSVAFSPRSQILAVGSDDGSVQLWDTATDQEIGSPLVSSSTDSGPVMSLAFSPGGQTLAAVSQDGAVQIWDTSYFADVARRLCAKTGRSLTPAEWTRYVGNLGYQETCPQYAGTLPAPSPFGSP